MHAVLALCCHLVHGFVLTVLDIESKCFAPPSCPQLPPPTFFWSPVAVLLEHWLQLRSGCASTLRKMGGDLEDICLLC